MLNILIVDDDQGLRLAVRTALQRLSNVNIDEAFDGADAIEKFEKENHDIVVLDVDLPRVNGIEVLKKIKQKNPGTIVIMLTAYANIHDAVQAVKIGAYNYLSKPVSGDQLIDLIEKATRAHNLISSVAASAPIMTEAGRKIIGNTLQMQKVFMIIDRLSKVDTPVLVRGASGTGKELVARAIHYNSSRKDEKFVAINCSAIPENLFESELFGHEKGAFTSADQRKIGKFQFAEGGTLFLDEVGDMPPMMQVKLLRVLQEKTFTPVGSNRELNSNVRIIAATNRPLEDMIQKGSFREDLFYRLNVMPIFLPPLKDRKDDLERLVNIFIKKFNQAQGRNITGITVDALTCLERYDWPGNIRELENVIEHAFILETSNVLTLASLPENLLEITGVNLVDVEDSLQIRPTKNENASSPKSLNELELPSDSRSGEPSSSTFNISEDNLDFNAQKEAFEKEFIIKALKTFNGRINQTALHANIPKKTLLRKIEKYGINAKDYINS